MEQSEIKLFEGQNIRYVWDEGKEQYFFSVVDVIQVLTESTTPRRYWSDLKRKLAVEGSELYEKIVQLKLPSSDGKKYLTDVATTEQLLRLIQSIPSKKAEPFKLWLAEVGRQRLEQLQDPEQSIEQAIRDYRRLGYRENPQGFRENAEIAHRGGNVAHVAREQLEHELGTTVISNKRALHFTTPPDELPLVTEEE